MKGRVATWIGAKLERRIACWGVGLSLALILTGGAGALAVFGSPALDGIHGSLPVALALGALGLAVLMGWRLARLRHLGSGLEGQVDRRIATLRQALAERAQVLAAMEDVISSFTPGLERMLYINPAIRRLTGMPPEEFLARPDLLREIIDPLDRDGWEAALAGLGPETPSAQAVFRVIGPGGGRRWLHGRYQLNARSDDGLLVIDGIASDITERRVAELAVASSEARLRAIFETVGDSIITIDGFGFIEGANRAACRLFGYEADEMIGRNVALLMPEPDHSAHDGYIRRYIATGHGRVIGGGREVVALRRNGEAFPAELAVGVLRLGDEKPSFVGVLRDITERKGIQDALRAAKEAAEAAGNAKAEFLAMMSHEIRTPLNGVLGMIGLLEDGEVPADQRRYVDAARRSGEALLTILNDILDFSKMEAGRLDLVPAPLDIGRLAADVVEELGASAREKTISLTVEVGSGVPTRILADGGRVRQVLLNLVSNAVKFTHRGGVRVVLSAAVAKVRVEVIDSGIGIPEEARGRLFNRFSQVDSSTSRRYGGTGLGLAIARRLVELMGGEIGVVSAPGSGSTFWFTVPGDSPPAEDEAPTEPVGAERDCVGRPRMPARWRAGGRILLVEDSETNRLVATTILEKAGYRVETAEDGVEAVAAVSEGRFDLVLMDIAMPEMDGFQATAAIRALPDPVLAAVPIIALTANALVGDRAHCLAAGMDDYLPKPLPKAQLLAMVERFLGRPAIASAGVAARSPEAGPAFGALRSLIQDIPAEVLGHIIDTYVADARTRLGRMDEAIANRDLAALEREAHPIKSSSRTFGLEALGAKAEQVENACRAGDADQALALTRDLVSHSEAAFATLRAELAKLAPAAPEAA